MPCPCPLRTRAGLLVGALVPNALRVWGCFGAEGGIRTPTPYGATPSRWCVCQFRHFRERRGEKNPIMFHELSQRCEARAADGYFDGVVGAGVVVPGAVGAGVDAFGVAGAADAGVAGTV